MQNSGIRNHESERARFVENETRSEIDQNIKEIRYSMRVTDMEIQKLNESSREDGKKIPNMDRRTFLGYRASLKRRRQKLELELEKLRQKKQVELF